jgi:hypothetical protein
MIVDVVHMTVLSSQAPRFVIPGASQANHVAGGVAHGWWVENVNHLSE